MKPSWVAISLTCLCAAAAVAAPLQTIKLRDINGQDTSLKAYEGKVLLIVNVASQCGFTPQYRALEAMHRKYKDRGFSVLAFPCNDFGAQEPGTNEEIKQFCATKYQVSFPLFDKIHVKGREQHPLYQALTANGSPFPGEVPWNFAKFLIGRDGKILRRFEPKVKPDAPQVTQAIEAALAAK